MMLLLMEALICVRSYVVCDGDNGRPLSRVRSQIAALIGRQMVFYLVKRKTNEIFGEFGLDEFLDRIRQLLSQIRKYPWWSNEHQFIQCVVLMEGLEDRDDLPDEALLSKFMPICLLHRATHMTDTLKRAAWPVRPLLMGRWVFWRLNSLSQLEMRVKGGAG